MPRKKEPARVLGPFVEGARWRVVAVDDFGRRKSYTVDTAQAARRLSEKLVKQTCTVNSALTAWSAARVRNGNALAKTVEHEEKRARSLLGKLVSMGLNTVTERRAAAAYERYRTEPSLKTGKPLAAKTHRCDLQIVCHLWSWAGKQHLANSNPWQAVEPAGRVNRGKPGLRPSEARAFGLAAEGAAHDGNGCALAALLCLSLGLRASESLSITPRDVDGGDLFVAGTKTPTARRRLKLSPLLQQLLSLATQGKVRTERLCTKNRQALSREVANLCRRAGVPVVCIHALRGTHASLAVESGASVEAVARALGHTSTRITKQHYITDEASDEARISAFEHVMYPSPIIPPA